MNKIIVLLVATVGLISCKTSGEEVTKLEIAKNYYKFLDSSDDSGIKTILGDSIVIRESQDDYQEQFSKAGYVQWLEWDSVFDPTYKILEIQQENEIVKAKISKIDKRLYFLTGESMIWNEILSFENSKVIKVERVEYEVFDVQKFVTNRERLVKWIDENHSELSGFLYPQTKSVGMQYLKSIELYENQK